MSMNENEKIVERTQEQIQEKKDLVQGFNITNPLKDRITFPENDKETMVVQAENLVNDVLNATYLDENEKLKNFTNFGKQEERSSDKMLMKNKTLANLESNLVKNGLTDKLVDLRKNMSEITESHSGNQPKSFMEKIKRKIMKTKYVGDAVIKRQEVGDVITGIIGDLYTSRDVLIKDNTMLENFEQSAKEEIYHLQKQIAFGEGVYNQLLTSKDSGAFDGKEHLFEEALFKTLNRTKLLNDKLLQLLQASEAAKNIHKNNEKLIDNIGEYSKSAESMMYVSVFISDSLSSQAAALKGVNEVKTFINDLMIQNAEMLYENQKDVNNFMSTGILDIETAKKSLEILNKTIAEQEASTRKNIEESRKHIDEMTNLMEDLNKKYTRTDEE